MKPPPKLPLLAKFGPKTINPGTGRLHVHPGKPSPMLPGRHALNVLSKGNPSERSFNNFAKSTPIGSGGPMTYQSIMDMGLNGIDPAGGAATSAPATSTTPDDKQES